MNVSLSIMCVSGGKEVKRGYWIPKWLLGMKPGSSISVLNLCTNPPDPLKTLTKENKEISNFNIWCLSDILYELIS